MWTPEEPQNDRFVVSGTQYRVGYPGFLGQFCDGDEMELIPEPDNPYDCYAVKVVVNNLFVGYVPQYGSTCGDCLAPLHRSQQWCHICGSLNIMSGGLAFRLIKSGALDRPYKAYVTSIRDDQTSPIHGEVWTIKGEQ